MNSVFFVMTAASLILMTVTSPDDAFPAMIDGASGAITLAVKLCAIYAIWLSVLDIMEKIGLSKALNKLFAPISKRLFKGEDEKTREYVSLNFSANLLGMGSAATPMGIKAMERMQDGTDKATDNMIFFMVINATSIQLLPATVIGLRSAAGSASASDIILPSLIATLVSTVSGAVLAKVLALPSRSKKPRLGKPLNGAKF
ncbi:MAG TPA: hypothetical protein IAA90_02380 [Candidatus Ornithoclostridium excrementipullorum]|nr:hypothetical protein [Candidatus Ornithoclostridium excrementipullorum]